MSDLVTRLRTAAPVGKLLQEAADALDAAEHRVAELAETLRAVVEISNSQRAREFADVKRTLDKARALLGGRSGGIATRTGRSPERAGPGRSPERAAPDRSPERTAPDRSPERTAPGGGGAAARAGRWAGQPRRSARRGRHQRDVQGNQEFAQALRVRRRRLPAVAAAMLAAKSDFAREPAQGFKPYG